METREDKKRSRFGETRLYNLRHAELEIFAKYWCQCQCPAGWAGDMGLPGGDGRYRGMKDQIIHAALTNKTDMILDSRASITADLFRAVQVEARPLLAEDRLGMSTRRQLGTTISRKSTTSRKRSYSHLTERQFPCFIFLMLFTSKSGITCG